MFEYTAFVVKVYDGDTITVDIDLGFGVWTKGQVVRLYGINTPEVKGEEREEGLKVRDYVRKLIMSRTVTIKTHKDSKGKYGRWLAEVFVDDVSVNEVLIEKGMAKRYG